MHEVPSGIHNDRYLPNVFPVHGGLKQRNVSSPQLFHFILVYAVRKAREIKEGLDLNGLNQVTCLFILMTQKVVAAHHSKRFKMYPETTVRRWHEVQHEIRRRINFEDARYYLVQKPLISAS
jgi:hypothetical protein